MNTVQEKRQKTGILGGTFNPIHLGHLHLAQKALETARLDKILFVPSGVSYMKNPDEILPASERTEMVRLAVSDNPAFDISTIEIEKTGNSYSHETIRALQQEEPDTEFFFLTGADTVFSMENWKDPASIFHAVTVLAAYRNGASLEALKRQITHLRDIYQADIRLIAADHIDISSSGIREAIRLGRPIEGMVPKKVAEYIAKRHFYQ